MKKLLMIYLLLAFPLNLLAADSHPLWEKKAKAQSQWQTSLANLMILKQPMAKELIIIQRDLQLKAIETRSERYYHLLKNHPSRIVRDQGLSKWMNFDWSDADEENLIKTSTRYKKLMDEKNGLKLKTKGHPLWPELRTAFKDIRKTKEYKKLYNRLMDVFKSIEKDLNK